MAGERGGRGWYGEREVSRWDRERGGGVMGRGGGLCGVGGGGAGRQVLGCGGLWGGSGAGKRRFWGGADTGGALGIVGAIGRGSGTMGGGCAGDGWGSCGGCGVNGGREGLRRRLGVPGAPKVPAGLGEGPCLSRAPVWSPPPCPAAAREHGPGGGRGESRRQIAAAGPSSPKCP